MESVYLHGAEDVARAGSAMRSAAEEISRCAGWFQEALSIEQTRRQEALDRYEQITKDALDRFENLVVRLEAIGYVRVARAERSIFEQVFGRKV